MLEAEKSYSIILDSNTKDNTESFAVNLVMRYIVELNLQKGITIGKSMFSKGLVISDTEYPNSRTIVISRTNRKSDQFELLDISENKWDLLLLISGISKSDSDKELTKFIKVNLKNEKNTDILFYYIMNLKQTSFTDNQFDIAKANKSLQQLRGIYKQGGSRTDKMVALINFIKFPKEDLLFEMLKQYNNDFKQIASNIQALSEDRLPKNLVDMFEDIINSIPFTRNLLQMMSYLVLCEDYNEFVLSCLKMVKN